MDRRFDARAPRRVGIEILLVLGLSLGQSAVYSILRIIERMTRPQPLGQQTTSMNTSTLPDRPWLDLSYQVANNLFPLLAVGLAIYFLWLAYGRGGSAIGFDLKRPGFDLGCGLLIAAGIGIPGLGFYIAAHQLGMNTAIEPVNLAQNWWTIPVLVLSAVRSGIEEEVIMIGFLFTRLKDLNWPLLAILFFSAVIRGSYHLYQGFGAALGNLVMGIVFGVIFWKLRRVGPLVVAHTTINVVAFVGSTATGWLPW